MTLRDLRARWARFVLDYNGVPPALAPASRPPARAPRARPSYETMQAGLPPSIREAVDKRTGRGQPAADHTGNRGEPVTDPPPLVEAEPTKNPAKAGFEEHDLARSLSTRIPTHR